MDPTTEGPHGNMIFIYSCPSISSPQLSPFPTSKATKCQKYQWQYFFQLYSQSLTVGCFAGCISRPSRAAVKFGTFLINEMSSLVLSGLMCCSAAGLVWRHGCFWSLVIRSQQVLSAYRGAIMKVVTLRSRVLDYCTSVLLRQKKNPSAFKWSAHNFHSCALVIKEGRQWCFIWKHCHSVDRCGTAGTRFYSFCDFSFVRYLRLNKAKDICKGGIIMTHNSIQLKINCIQIF